MIPHPPHSRLPYRPARIFLALAAPTLLLVMLSCMPSLSSFSALPFSSGSSALARITGGYAASHVSSAPGAYLASIAAAGRGDYARAAHFLQQAGAGEEAEPEFLARLFAYRLAAGNFPAALKLAAQLSPGRGYDQGQILLGLHELRRGEGEAAYRRWSARGRQSDFPGYAIVAAWAAQRREQGPPVYDNWLAAPPGRDIGSLQQVRLFHRAMIADLQDRPETEDFYRQSLSQSRRPSGRAVLAYALFLERKGRMEDARTLFQSLAAGPGFENPAGRDALARSREAGSLPPRLVPSPLAGVAEFLNHMAMLSLFSQDEETAVLSLQMALYANPDNALTRLYLSDLLGARGLHPAGIDVLEQVGSHSLYYTLAQSHIATAYERQAQSGEALEKLLALARATPRRPGPHVALGDFYRREEKFEPAAKAYTRAIDLSPVSDWNLLYMRGIAYERAGRWDEAEKDLRAAIRLSRGDPLVMNYLAYSWVEQKRHLPQALELLEQAIRKRPGSGFITDSLGWAYYHTGDYSRALFYLEHAAELAPDEAIINDHLGDALWQVGRHIEARFQWQRALDAGPEKETRIAALRRKLLLGLAEENQEDRRAAQETGS